MDIALNKCKYMTFLAQTPWKYLNYLTSMYIYIDHTTLDNTKHYPGEKVKGLAPSVLVFTILKGIHIYVFNFGCIYFNAIFVSIDLYKENQSLDSHYLVQWIVS